MQLMKILWERREFFGVCLLEHIRISLTAVLCAGVLGIAIGIWISRHKKAAGSLLIALLALLSDFLLSRAEKRVNGRYGIE